MAHIGRELIYTLRSLRRNPAFTLIVVATLALGIGGNTLLLSVVRATFFARFPFPDSARVLRLLASYRNPGGSVSTVTVRGREYGVLEKVVTGPAGPFSSLAALEVISATLTGAEAPEKLTVIHCAGDWSGTLGVAPIVGRWLGSTERQNGEYASAVIDHDLWLRRFGGNPGVLGRPLTLDGSVYTVIGVMPAGFRFPYDGEVWIPTTRPYDSVRDYAVFGRLRPGATARQAQAALASAAEAMRKEYPDTAQGFGFTQISLLDNLQDEQQGAALALLGVAGFFLFLTCANVANLLLARSVVRQREEAIRTALGATGWQLLQRYLLEGIVLSGLGALTGILLASLMAPLVADLVPSNFVTQLGIRPNPLDTQVALATVLLGVLGGVLVGLLPALRSVKKNDEWLTRASQRSGAGLQERRAMNAFVVLQFTLALALLAGAGLMLQNFNRLVHRDLGFDASHLLSMQVSVSASRLSLPPQRLRWSATSFAKPNRPPG